MTHKWLESTYRGILSIVTLICFAVSGVAAEHLSITTTLPGQVKDKILDSDFEGLTSLSIQGPVNAADVEYLTSNTGIMASVRTLDISKVTAVLDGSVYRKHAIPTGSMGVSNIYEFRFWPRDSVSGRSSIDGPVHVNWGNHFGGAFIKTGFEKVILPENITSIGDMAFFDCKNLKEVVCGGNEASVGVEAFSGAEALQSITFPVSVKAIGHNAFYGTTALERIDLSGVTSMDYRCFKRSGLKSVILGVGLEMIPAECFYECESLQSVIFPSSLRDIGEQAFYRCFNMTEVTFNEGLETIGASAFVSNRILKEMRLPDSLMRIGSKAFYDCLALENVTVPENLMDLGEDAFKLTPYISRQPSEGGVIYIGKVAYQLTDDVPVNLVIRDGTVGVGQNLMSFSLRQPSGAYISANKFVESVSLPPTVRLIGCQAFAGCSKITSMTLPEGLEEIGDKAFQETKLKGLLLPSTVRFIGEAAFMDCGLSAIELPQGIESIGESAFSGNSFTSVVIPEGVIALGSKSFAENNKLVRITYNCIDVRECDAPFRNSSCDRLLIGDRVEIIPDMLMSGVNAGFREVKFPASLRHIGDEAFSMCKSLTTADLPAGIEYIGTRAFFGTSLTEVRLPEGLAMIGDGAFAEISTLRRVEYNCRNLESEIVMSSNGSSSAAVPFSKSGCSEFVIGEEVETVIPSLFKGANTTFRSLDLKNVRSIGEAAFQGTLIESVVISDAVTELPHGVFSRCPQLRSVKLPSHLEAIGSAAFSQCSNLAGVELPESLIRIENGAFYGCRQAFSRLALPPHIKYVGVNAFYECEDICSIFIPEGIEEIEQGALMVKGRRFDKGLVVTNMNRIPLMLSASPFATETSAEYCQYWKLKVPYGCDRAYRDAQFWSGFETVEPIGELICTPNEIFSPDFNAAKGCIDSEPFVAGGIFYSLDKNVDSVTDDGCLSLWSSTSADMEERLPGRRMETHDIADGFNGLYLLLPPCKGRVEIVAETYNDDTDIVLLSGDGSTLTVNGYEDKPSDLEFELSEPTPLFIYLRLKGNWGNGIIKSIKVIPSSADSGLEGIDDEEAPTVIERYQLDGRKVVSPSPGQIVIERLSDGIVRKIIAE